MGLFSGRGRGEPARVAAPITVSYEAKPVDGPFDQVLTIRNNTEDDLVPILRFVPLNAYGHQIADVTTTTVQGTDRGQLEVPAGLEARDVLRFDGIACRDVRHVQVAVVELAEVDATGHTSGPEALWVNLEERATDDPADFWGVGVVNRNEQPMRMRLTLVEVEERFRDHPRQPVDWVSVQGDVELAPSSHQVVWLPEDTRGRFTDVLCGVAAPPLD